MLIDTTTTATTSAAEYTVGRDPAAAPPRSDLTPPTDSVPPEIQQLCRPSSVSLSPEATQGLLDYTTYNASAQAATVALTQTMRLHDLLARQLGTH